MRKTHLKWLLLLAVALFMPWTSTAQNATHGVDGFYNYTAAQMQAEDILTVGGNGKKFPEKWHPEVSYTEDGYVKLILGANNTTLDATNGGYQHRSNVGFKQVDGKALTITKKYPVLVYKVSIPFNNEGCDASTPEKAYWEPEYLLSDGSGTGLNGLESNRKRFITTNPAIKDALGRDTVYFAKDKNSGYDHRRTANVVHTERKDTIWHCVRLDPSAGEKADILIAIDFSTICAKAEEGGGVRMLDTTNIDLRALDIMSWLNVYADTLYTDESGTQQVKTKDMMPYALCKWVKTFDSLEAFDASLTAENGYGDNYAGLAAAEEPETPAAFRDIKVDLTNGAFLTEAEIADKSSVSFGIAIAEDGTQTRVAADEAS
ncbi:MAG: hypothetical protein IJY36_01420, partial [Coprobacter sp.]|nr:hypothetical protein [Coprobacter sp.]